MYLEIKNEKQIERKWKGKRIVENEKAKGFWKMNEER